MIFYKTGFFVILVIIRICVFQITEDSIIIIIIIIKLALPELQGLKKRKPFVRKK